MSGGPEPEGELERFERLLELEPEAREQWLDQLAGHEPAAADGLRALLRAHDSEGSLLDFAAPAVDPRSLQPTVDLTGGATRFESDPLPTAIGPYRVLAELGRGGMGRVYLAEQSGEGFTRKVAIKRLDLGASSAASERRFREETRILAALEHPGIARFLDGGRDQSGTAFLVLEYVDGLDLLSHAEARALDLEARLRLFLEVLDSVAYAHERGVVHRDLKPSNVLVGADGRARLLDFGISKLTEPGDGAIAATRTDTRALTPAYASPEQLAGEPVERASDVYSLGVVLYELVAGVRPFADDAGDPRAWQRAVLERDPEPPSTASRRATRTGELAARASAVDVAGARVRLGRDLDAICLRALRKEPTARYGSVGEFGADLRRLLEARPVLARRGGVVYRAAKLARRHRALVATAAIAGLGAVALLLALQRYTAEQERASFEVAAERPTLPPIGELSARFAAQPDRPELGLELVEALLDAGRGPEAMGAVGRLRQLPGELGKGVRIDLAEARAAHAISEHQKASALASAVRREAERSGDGALARRAAALQARTLFRLGAPLDVVARASELFAEAERAADGVVAAEALLLRAMAERNAAQGEAAAQTLTLAVARAERTGARALESEALAFRGRLEGEAGEIDRGLASLERALALALGLGNVALEANALFFRAALNDWKGDGDGALRDTERAIERLRVSGSREMMVTALANLTEVYTSKGEHARAANAIGEAEPIALALGTARSLAMVWSARASLEQERGNEAAARAAYASAIAAARESGIAAGLANHLSSAAWFESTAGNERAAEAMASEAVTLYRRGGDERSAIEAASIVAWAMARRGEGAKARAEIARLERQANESESASARYMVLVAKAKILEELGDPAGAIALRREAIGMAPALGVPTRVPVHQVHIARLLELAGDRTGARATCVEVLPELERIGLVDEVTECRGLVARIAPPATNLPDG